MPKISIISTFLLMTIVSTVLFAACTVGRTEVVAVPTSNSESENEASELKIVTLLGYDSIPAILAPNFVDIEVAERWMEADEQVLGLSINGDDRAYSVPMLSRHEIVNDTVGGVPVAVTW